MTGGDLRRAAAGTLLASFPGADVPGWLLRRVAGGLGGVCLYGSNREADLPAVAAALHGARDGVVVALDEEGGDVTRLEATTGSSLPGNAALGGVDDVALTAAVARALGDRLRSVGVDLDLAPCADVNSDPANPVIGVRSFGADPALVARHTASFVTGLQAAGVAACAKHFPGHGAVAVDSHLALPTLAAPAPLLEARELVPFRAAVAAGVAAVMPGHLLVPALDAEPASVSRRIVGDLLRGDLGFTGTVVTDALDMGGAGGPAAIPTTVVRALAAGADLCCLGPDNDDALVGACVDAVVAAVAAGDLPAARVHDAARRAADLRCVPHAGTRPPLGGRAGHGPDPAGPAPAGVAGGGTCTAVVAAPAVAAPASGGDLAVLGAEAARRALRVDGRLPGPLPGAHVVELDRPANIAAGAVPWGLAAAVARRDPSAGATRVAEGDDRAVASALLAARGRPLIVAARDAHRRPAQAAALATLLTARPDAVLVDMGWPAGDALPPAATRITTFGAAAACGEAVAALLLNPEGNPRG
jgi:beta-N-acetylhexosaminidase